MGIQCNVQWRGSVLLVFALVVCGAHGHTKLFHQLSLTASLEGNGGKDGGSASASASASSGGVEDAPVKDADMMQQVSEESKSRELATYWDTLKAVDQSTPLDPWNFEDRMRFYKFYMDATKTDALCGPNASRCSRHYLWGLPIQLWWQKRSERLNSYNAVVLKLVWNPTTSKPLLSAKLRCQIKVGNKQYVTEEREFTDGPQRPFEFSLGLPDKIVTAGESVEVQLQYLFLLTWRNLGKALTVTLQPKGNGQVQDEQLDVQKAAGTELLGKMNVQTFFLVNPCDKDKGVCDKINPMSWWAAMNYYLAIVPGLGAVAAGVIPAITFKKPAQVDSRVAASFCVTVEECQQPQFNTYHLIEKWKAFFVYWKDHIKTASSLSEHTLSEWRHLMWEAHTSSIVTSEPLLVIQEAALPVLERQAGVGWAHFVEFIAAARFRTTFVLISKLQPFLPQHQLKKSDTVVLVDKANIKQVAIINVLVTLYKISNMPECFGPILQAWKDSMKSKEGRVKGERIIAQTFDDPATFLPNFVSVVLEVIKVKGVKEVIKITNACELASLKGLLAWSGPEPTVVATGSQTG